MSNFADEADAKTLAAFWAHLAKAGWLPIGDDTDMEQQVKAFLRERAEKREREYGKQ